MSTRNKRGMFRSRMLFAALAVGFCNQGIAQTVKSFEVATIKPSAPLDMTKLAADVKAGKMPRFGPHIEANRAEYVYMPLKDLIALAYRMKGYQVSGPAWMASERFDIVATYPANATKDDAPEMLQQLLAQRFGLKAHRDNQEQSVLALAVGKSGQKLKPSTETPKPIDESAPLKPGETKIDTADGPAILSRNSDSSTTIDMGLKGKMTQRMDMQNQSLRIESDGVTMPGFAEMLTRMMQMGGGGNKIVVDQTGIKGTYQVAISISLASLMEMARSQGMNVPSPGQRASGDVASASDPVSGQSIYESVQALGLKLEPGKAKIDQLVVDNVSKAPTEN